ncbi:hypothetical protein BD779DRAFT_675356 [Infundibulicybe gibba]|nr:hypothetical protein BD779DRAFT_675356 [Infundibulicybe gibba]
MGWSLSMSEVTVRRSPDLAGDCNELNPENAEKIVIDSGILPTQTQPQPTARPTAATALSRRGTVSDAERTDAIITDQERNNDLRLLTLEWSCVRGTYAIGHRPHAIDLLTATHEVNLPNTATTSYLYNPRRHNFVSTFRLFPPPLSLQAISSLHGSEEPTSTD